MIVSLWKYPRRYQWLIRELGRKVRASLREERKLCTVTTWLEVEALIASDPPMAKEAWIRMQGWYNDTEDRPTPHRNNQHQADENRKVRALKESTPPWGGIYRWRWFPYQWTTMYLRRMRWPRRFAASLGTGMEARPERGRNTYSPSYRQKCRKIRLTLRSGIRLSGLSRLPSAGVTLRKSTPGRPLYWPQRVTETPEE